jgi:hypothetical protein
MTRRNLDEETLPPWVREAIAEERESIRTAREFAGYLAAAAGPLWHLGDGRGGYVTSLLAEALVEEGLIEGREQLTLDWRPTVRPAVEKLAKRDGWSCAYCDRPLGWGHPSVFEPTVDHKIPTSRGGSDELDNLALSCAPCNASKGNRTPEELLVWRIRRIMAEREALSQ